MVIVSIAHQISHELYSTGTDLQWLWYNSFFSKCYFILPLNRQSVFGDSLWCRSENSVTNAVVFRHHRYLFRIKEWTACKGLILHETARNWVGMHDKNIQRNWGSRTSHLWQPRQSRSVEAKLHILGNEGRPQEWKRNFSYLAVKAEQKRRRGELHIIGSPGRNEMQKWNFTSLEVLAEQVRKQNMRSFEVLAKRKCGKRNFRSVAVKAEVRKRSFRP